mgnify:CR=1 FL=1
MNALEAASLVMIPSGYEDGTLGSLKPIDGSGDFTFSRGSNLSATRVKEDGYIEKGYENLLLQSNQFDTTWTQSAVSVTSGQSGYDGTNNAWLQSKTSGSYVNIAQSIAISGVWTLSIYAKANTLDSITFRNQTDGSDCDFDLTNGTTSTYTTIASSINLISNGWYRCSATFSGSTTQIAVYLGFGNSTAGSVFIQDAQLNQGLVALPYVESGATNGLGGLLENDPRIDFTGGGCGSLLLEPSRTNELANSEYFEAGTLSNATLSLSGTSIENVTNAYALTENTANAEHYWISERMTTATNNNLVSTIFVKPNGRTKIKLWNYHLANQLALVDIDLTTNTTSNGGGTNVTFVSANVTDYSNGWKRVEIQSIKSASTYAYGIRVTLLDDNGSDVYAGDGTSGVLIYGAQMEQNVTYKTSYIPTYGVSQTRADEVCGGAGDAATFNDSEGVFYAEISTNTDNTDKALSINNSISGGSNSRLWMGYSTTGKRVYALGYVNNSIQFALSKLMTDESVFVKIACKYALNDVSFFVNGEKVGTDTSALEFIGLNSLDFNIGTGAGSGAAFYGKAKQVLVFKQALSDSELAALTTI